jgi:hypothetical protein
LRDGIYKTLSTAVLDAARRYALRSRPPLF